MIIQSFEMGAGKAPTAMYYLQTIQEIIENTPDIPENWITRSKYWFEAYPYFLSSNTYFNRLDVRNLNCNSTINEIHLEIECQHEVEIRIMSSSKGSVKLFQKNFTSQGRSSFLLPTVGIDYFWVDLFSEEPIDPHSLKYSFRSPETKPLALPVTIGICTTSQGKMVSLLCEKIAQASFANQVSEILIVDHGKQSVLNDLLNIKNLRIIRQPNTGAAGGFGRLMYESRLNQGDGTFLFDEDIDVEMFVLERVLAFAAVSGNSTVIGTQTLNLFKRDQYWMEYEKIDIGRGQARPLPNSMNRQSTQIPQSYFEEINSIPWTCAYFPNSALEAVGLPIPIFFHCDDWDFSLRLEMNKIGMIMPSGFGHWHLPPDAKSFYSWPLYFDVRNLLILQSIHGFSTRKSILKFQVKAIFCLLSHRYAACERILRGISDYRRGPEVLSVDQLERAKATMFESVWRELETIDYFQFQHRRFHKVRTLMEIFRNLIVNPSNKTTYFPLRNSHRSEIFNSRQAIVFSQYGDEIEFLSYSRSTFGTLLGKIIRTGLLAAMPQRKYQLTWEKFAGESVSDDKWQNRWDI